MTSFLKYVFIDSEERKEEEERNIDYDREALIGCLLYAPHRGLSRNLGMRPDWKSNRDLLVHGTMRNH